MGRMYFPFNTMLELILMADCFCRRILQLFARLYKQNARIHHYRIFLPPASIMISIISMIFNDFQTERQKFLSIRIRLWYNELRQMEV
jgi:hypothetical protein